MLYVCMRFSLYKSFQLGFESYLGHICIQIN